MKITETLPNDPYEGKWSITLETLESCRTIHLGRGVLPFGGVFRPSAHINDAYSIKDLLIQAYNAGKNGESLDEIVYLEKEEDDLE